MQVKIAKGAIVQGDIHFKEDCSVYYNAVIRTEVILFILVLAQIFKIFVSFMEILDIQYM